MGNTNKNGEKIIFFCIFLYYCLYFFENCCIFAQQINVKDGVFIVI